jgi:hypothetical protein
MSIKSKVFAAAATLTLVGGVGSMAALSAGAATPSCGHDCLDLFSREFGTHQQPNYVMDVWRQGAKVGQPVILFRTSNTDPAEDFNTAFSGFTSEFNEAGLVSNTVALHYGCAGQFHTPCSIGVDDAPFGVDSGLCVGVASTAVQNEGVSLQPCGVSARTVWILDLNDSPSTFNHDYIPLINGSDTNFSHPFVLTYPKNGFPTDRPRPQLLVQNLTGFTQGHFPHGTPIGNVDDNQLWGADWGILR